MSRYFDFLSNIVDGDDYSLLLKHLHRIEFYSLVPNDDNRGEDGVKLREIFVDEGGPNMDSSSLREVERMGPCTVLEMMIALSIRMEGELHGNPRSKSAKECFWQLLENLGLDWCDNTGYFNADGDNVVYHKISRLLERRYRSNGDGGLFPLRRPSKDQREVEIWYQMSEYLLERFEF